MYFMTFSIMCVFVRNKRYDPENHFSNCNIFYCTCQIVDRLWDFVNEESDSNTEDGIGEDSGEPLAVKT